MLNNFFISQFFIIFLILCLFHIMSFSYIKKNLMLLLENGDVNISDYNKSIYVTC